MRTRPALKNFAPILCLVLAGAMSVASGAPVKHKARKSVRVYADPSAGDVTQFDDPIVRQIAIDALGHEQGSVVAIDPSDGRILSIVNQKMAFSAGFEPCSTIKPFV